MKLLSKVKRCKCGRFKSTDNVCNRCCFWAGFYLAMSAWRETLEIDHDRTLNEAQRLITNMQ